MVSSGKLLALCCFLVSAHGRILDFSIAFQMKLPEANLKNNGSQVSCEDVIPSDSLLPHPEDCERFYYCVHPNLPPVIRQCPSNLHFNPTLHVCDWPSHAGCEVTKTTTEYTTSPTLISSTIAERHSTSAAPSDERPTIPEQHSTSAAPSDERPTIPEQHSTSAAPSDERPTLPEQHSTSAAPSDENPTIPEQHSPSAAPNDEHPNTPEQQSTSAASDHPMMEEQDSKSEAPITDHVTNSEVYITTEATTRNTPEAPWYPAQPKYTGYTTPKPKKQWWEWPWW